MAKYDIGVKRGSTKTLAEIFDAQGLPHNFKQGERYAAVDLTDQQKDRLSTEADLHMDISVPATNGQDIILRQSLGLD